jgi:hypothetical protein
MKSGWLRAGVAATGRLFVEAERNRLRGTEPRRHQRHGPHAVILNDRGLATMAKSL